MHYKKYETRSPLFALKDPALSAAVLAAFAGARARRELARPQQNPAPSKTEAKPR